MLKRNIIVIGGSAGGVETLSQLVKALPADLPAAVFVTLHFPPYATSVLPQILNRCRTLPAMHANDGDPIELGRIYIAPPDNHLLLGNDRVRLGRGPRENGHRPAVDVMFRSAAHFYGQRTIGVILSGMLDDGTAGLKLIKAYGGVAIAQDPSEVLFDGMVSSAIRNVKVDAILRLSDLATQLVVLSQTPIEEDNSVSNRLSNNLEEEAEKDNSSSDNLKFNSLAQEAEIVAQSKAELEQGKHPETSPSMVTCPDCGGVLWELRNNGLIRYRCHVGHAYSSDSLLSEQTDLVETSLWSAVRALEEKAALAERMAKQAREQKRTLSEAQFLRRAEEARQQAGVVRGIISTQSEKMQQVKDEGSVMKE